MRQIGVYTRRTSTCADLGLIHYFQQHATIDREALQAYKEFRLKLKKRARHLKHANSPVQLIVDIPRYVNCIAMPLGGVTKAGRPVFLKIPYFGPEALEQLARYDSSIIVGFRRVSGTTHTPLRCSGSRRSMGTCRPVRQNQ